MGIQLDVATLAGGCFWCLEAVFKELQGVISVRSGYTGGTVPSPTYAQVCDGETGHAEAVQITYDPSRITYRDLLTVFFTIHDPTTPDRQGADVGPQYRSVIFYHAEDQKKVAEEVIQAISAAKLWNEPIVTGLVPLEMFYPAEEYHQDYYKKNPYQGYCRAIIAPKVAKFRQKFVNQLKK